MEYCEILDDPWILSHARAVHTTGAEAVQLFWGCFKGHVYLPLALSSISKGI